MNTFLKMRGSSYRSLPLSLHFPSGKRLEKKYNGWEMGEVQVYCSRKIQLERKRIRRIFNRVKSQRKKEGKS